MERDAVSTNTAIINAMDAQGTYGPAGAAVVAIAQGSRVDRIFGPHVTLTGDTAAQEPWGRLVATAACAGPLAIWRHRDGYISEQIVAACIAVFTEGPALAVLRSGRGVSGWNSYVQTSVHRAARVLEQPQAWRAVEALATTLVFGAPMAGCDVHAIVDAALDTR